MTDHTWKPCRKKPIVVHVREAAADEGEKLFTREGLTLARPDDLVMRGVEGEIYPIGREIFERTYDLIPAGSENEVTVTFTQNEVEQACFALSEIGLTLERLTTEATQVVIGELRKSLDEMVASLLTRAAIVRPDGTPDET